MSQNYINHVALSLDASGSMGHLVDPVVQVADDQVRFLADRSKELDQETRATVYTWDGASYGRGAANIKCVFFDKDVLRMPTLRGHYRPYGSTPLIDATFKAIEDLEDTSTLYGDHAFLIYVLTDGGENSSQRSARELRSRLAGLPENWTIAALVPNDAGVREAIEQGFPAGNVMKWEVSVGGIQAASQKIQAATSNYMTMRSQGVRGTTNLFQIDDTRLTDTTVKKALTKIDPNTYTVIHNAGSSKTPIRELVEQATGQYKMGNAYYELVKTEEIQPQKQIIIEDRTTHDVYSGQMARQVLALPPRHISVAPTDHPKYDIFVQSTSVNRAVLPGQRVLVIK